MFQQMEIRTEGAPVAASHVDRGGQVLHQHEIAAAHVAPVGMQQNGRVFAATFLPTAIPCRSGHRDDCRLLCKHRPSIVNQALQPMGGDVQGRVIHRALVALGGFGALRLENLIDLFLDI
jgi:hypothetical protein